MYINSRGIIDKEYKKYIYKKIKENIMKRYIVKSNFNIKQIQYFIKYMIKEEIRSLINKLPIVISKIYEL
jgi:precorrin isomerase